MVKKLGVKGRLVGFEVFLDSLPAVKKKASKTRPLLRVSPYPAVERDFAFVVDAGVEAEIETSSAAPTTAPGATARPRSAPSARTRPR